ncbi:hypothetical protein FQR65_LT09356 [Abscondita terminalis]|nr:hypothetical protein FQR65_LT09356 [Abscondita terminalis]
MDATTTGSSSDMPELFHQLRETNWELIRQDAQPKDDNDNFSALPALAQSELSGSQNRDANVPIDAEFLERDGFSFVSNKRKKSDVALATSKKDMIPPIGKSDENIPM